MMKENNSRLTRWSLASQSPDFTVKYRAGKVNTNADSLSRLLTITITNMLVIAEVEENVII